MKPERPRAFCPRDRRERRVLYASLLTFAPFLISAIWPLFQFRGAERWPTVSAHISYLNSRQRVVSVQNRRSRGFAGLEKTGFQYSYTVSGEEFRSGRHTAFGAGPPIKKLAEAYQLGQEIEVRYNPANPGVSFIRLGASGINRPVVLVGLVATVLAALLADFMSPREA